MLREYIAVFLFGIIVGLDWALGFTMAWSPDWIKLNCLTIPPISLGLWLVLLKSEA
jgi:hypothetical protein